MEDPRLQEVWDKKKIFIGVCATAVVLGGALYGVKTFKGSQDGQQLIESVVKGAQTKKDKSQEFEAEIPIQSLLSTPRENVEKKIEEITKEISALDVQELASSSPQIQKVIKDIQSLEQYPRNQAREMCENICKNL